MISVSTFESRSLSGVLIRLVLILSVLIVADWPSTFLTSNANVPAVSGCLADCGQLRETALSPSLVFSSHAPTAFAFAVRRLIEPHSWAIAGAPRTRVQAWEFEPALQRPASSSLRSEDRDPRSGSGSSDAYWIDRAISLLKDMRRSPIRRTQLPRGKQSLAGEVFGTLVDEGVPTELARRLAHQVALRTYWEDHVTWRALGQLLLREADQLRVQVGLSDRLIPDALIKLSADDIQKLWEWLNRVDRAFASTILARAIQAADPVAAAHLYVDNYRKAFRAAVRADPAHAATLAGQVLTMRGASKNIRAKIKKMIKAQIQPDRSKWTLLLIAALLFSACQRPRDALLVHPAGWLSATISFGPLWAPGSLAKRQRDFLGSAPDAVLASAA